MENLALDDNLMQGYPRLFAVIVPASQPAIQAPALLRQQLDGFISELTPREQLVIRSRFGLLDGQAQTLQQIGNSLGVTRERIRQLEKKALRRLKHPTRAGKLKEIMEGVIK